MAGIALGVNFSGVDLRGQPWAVGNQFLGIGQRFADGQQPAGNQASADEAADQYENVDVP